MGVCCSNSNANTDPLHKEFTNLKNIDTFNNLNGIDKNENISTHNNLSIENSLVDEVMYDEFFQGEENKKIKKFKSDFIKELNSARTNPLNYVKKIKKHMQYIFLKPELESQQILYYYDNFNYPKTFLINGETSFQNCISILENSSPVHPLSNNKDICVNIKKEDTLPQNKNKFIDLIISKKSEIVKANTYNNFNFHYDNGALNAESSVVLQLVDDNNSMGMRRANLLDPNFKYIGISLTKIKDKRYYIYLSFASD